MALTTSYLTSTKNFEGIMNSILGARAPERFTNKFLEDLGYKSSNDRLITGVLKALGLLTDAGEPTQRYYDFLDQSPSQRRLLPSEFKRIGTIFVIGLVRWVNK